MQITLSETVVDMRISSEADMRHPIDGDGAEVQPFTLAEGREGVYAQYKLFGGLTYDVAEDQGQRLVDGGYAALAEAD